MPKLRPTGTAVHDHQSEYSELDEEALESSPHKALFDNVMSKYKRKIDGVHDVWMSERDSLKFQPHADPNKLLKRELANHFRRFERNVERSDKFANSVIEQEKKRVDMI